MDSSSHSAPTRFRLWSRRRWQWIVAAVVSCLLAWVVATRLFPGGSLELPAGSVTPKVSMGWGHGVVLAADGSLWSWGGEKAGCPVLGRGNTNHANLDPRSGQVGTDRDWVDVSAGDVHILALKKDGSMWGWGSDFRGFLGNGQFFKRMEHRPVPAAPGTNWAKVEAGRLCSLAIQRDGSLWAWGENYYGQLGIGTWIESPTPVRIGTSTLWKEVRQGGPSSAGIQTDGSLWIWGASPSAGTSKPRSTNNLLVPTLLAQGTTWRDVAVTVNLWAGIQSDGSLWVWGHDAVKYAGADSSNPASPVRIGSDADWRSVSASWGKLLLRKNDGSWWLLDQGDGTAASTPVPIPRLPVSALSGDVTGDAVAVLGADRRLWAHGVELGRLPTEAKLAAFVEALSARCGWKIDLGPTSDQAVRPGVWAIRHRTDE